MADESLKSNGNIRLRFYPGDTPFVNPNWPTVAELNAGIRLEDATKWDNFEVGVQASGTGSNPPISAKANVASRTESNYGGTLSIGYPGTYDDNGNDASAIYDLLDGAVDGYVSGWFVKSIDGEIGDPSQPAANFSFGNGDLITVMKLHTQNWEDMTEGDDPFYWTQNWLRNGFLAVNTVASTGTPVLNVTGDNAISVGETVLLEAEVNGRNWRTGARWISSDPAVARVVNGVLTGVSAGSATITASLPNSTVTDTLSVTVS